MWKRTSIAAAVVVLAGLGLAAPAGPGRPDGLAGVDAASGQGWFPHPRPLAALLLVADAGSDARLLREALAVLRDAGVSVLLLDRPAGGDEAQLQARVAEAWAQLRRRHGQLPLALAGHGQAAVRVTQLADGLEPPQRPQLLWLLAPGFADASPPQAQVLQAAAALARVDGLCNGRVERVTRVLLMHGADEAPARAWQRAQLADAAPAATVFRVDGAGHQDLLATADTRQLLQRLLSGWIHQSRAARAAWRVGAPGVVD